MIKDFVGMWEHHFIVKDLVKMREHHFMVKKFVEMREHHFMVRKSKEMWRHFSGIFPEEGDSQVVKMVIIQYYFSIEIFWIIETYSLFQVCNRCRSFFILL